MKAKILLLVACAAVVAGAVSHAQVIDFHAGGADMNIFYDGAQDKWDVVFRAKADTVATGLTVQADQVRHGAAATDFRFDTLNVIINQPLLAQAGARSYFITPALGQTYVNAQEPDLGVRTRLRTDAVTNQFTTFTMTLDWANSVRPTGAEFALFQFDAFGGPVFAYETAADNLARNWPVWGHTHWHWGFSELGNYTLAFNLQGELPGGGLSSIGTAMVNFEVIPEPATVAVFAGLAAIVFILLRRRTRVAKEDNLSA